MYEIPFTKKLLRSYTFFAAISIALYTPIIYILGLYEVAYLAALLVIMMLASYALTYYNYYNLSRVIFFSSIAAVIVASNLNKNTLNGVSFFLFPLVAYTFVLILNDERKFRQYISLMIFFSMILIIVLLSRKSNITLSIETKIFYVSNFILSFLLLSYLLGIISYKNIKKEKALLENQANVQTIMESVPQLIIQIDKDYLIKSFNNRFSSIVKALFDKKIELGRSIFEFTFDEDIDRVKKAIDLAFNGQQTITEKRVKLKNGNDLWIQLHYMPVEVQNSIESIIIIVSDQTEYKNLLISTNKLAAVAEESPIPIFEVNQNGLIQYANQAFINEFGISSGQHIPHTWMDFVISVFENLSQEEEIRFLNKTYKFYAKLNKVGETIRIYILDISPIIEKNNQLKAQKEFYEGIMNVVPSDIVVFDKNLKYTFVNKFAINDDKRREWIIGKTDKEYFELRNLPKDILEKRERNIIKAIETGREIEWTEEFNLNGEIFYYLRKIKPFYDENSNLQFLLGYGTDITLLKKAELEIEKQKKLYREILNNLPISVFLKSVHGKYIFANDKTLMYVGLKEDEFVGKTDHDIYPDKLAEEYRKTDLIVIDKGEYKYESELDTPWGKEYIYSGKKIIKLESKDELILGYSIDITDKILSKLELQRQTELNEKILETSPTLIYIKNADGKIFMANKATARLFGCKDPSEIIHKNPEDLGADRDELIIWKLNDKKVLDSDELHIFEETFTDKEGTKHWYLTHKIPFFVNNEKCILGIGVDITQLKIIQSELLELNRKAKEASEAKSLFLSNMSHEIRTPLNAIIGFGELMMEEPLDETVIEYTKTILFSARNLLSLVNDILDFSKLQEGKFSIHLVEFKLNDFVSNIEAVFRLKAREKSIYFKIERHFAPDLIIETDRTILNQILNNLISNAIKFTKIGGVNVKISVVGLKMLMIEVHDTGIGISDRFKEKIFNLFEQENTHLNREFGGTGLGLAITRKFVELLNGKIYFESSAGIGSIFYVEIPIEVLPSPHEDELPDSQELTNKENNTFYSEKHKHYHILIAEDNLVNQKLMSTVLERYGFSYDVANNGLEVLQKVADFQYDIILMDLHMPEMDGFKAAEMIRSNTGFKTRNDVPIAAVTADVLPETLRKCDEIGFNAFIRKPMELNQLFSLLKKLVLDE